MKTVTFDEARVEFERIFQLAAGGEIVVIQRSEQCVALQSYSVNAGPEIAHPGYFADDYSPEEAAELNAFASQGPRRPLP